MQTRSIRKAQSQAMHAIMQDTPHDKASARYNFISTAQVIDVFNSRGWEVRDVQGVRVRKSEDIGFQKHLVRFSHPELDATYKEATELAGTVTPQILLSNSHNTAASFRLRFGMFRFVCANGLIVSDGTCANIRVTHSAKNALEDVAAGIIEMTETAPKMYEFVSAMQSTTMSDAAKKDYEQKAMALRFGDINTPKIAYNRSLLEPRRVSDRKSDLWTVYNIAQENLIKGRWQYVTREDEAGRRVTSRMKAISGMQGQVKLNEQLWALNLNYIN
jgi:hypothetical protein